MPPFSRHLHIRLLEGENPSNSVSLFVWSPAGPPHSVDLDILAPAHLVCRMQSGKADLWTQNECLVVGGHVFNFSWNHPNSGPTPLMHPHLEDASRIDTRGGSDI